MSTTHIVGSLTGSTPRAFGAPGIVTVPIVENPEDLMLEFATNLQHQQY